jgi:Tol biopolymer transport system component
MTPSARYGAFISYSHAASKEVARGLEKWLQIYAKPWYRWRAIEVFRDETDLTASPSLWSTIADALDQSSHFILLASPNAVQSKWTKREIRYWLGDQHAGSLGGPDLDAPVLNAKPERTATLLVALTGGDIVWNDGTGDAAPGDFDWGETTALPHLLSGVFSEEPHWVDLRTIVRQDELRISLSRSNSEFMHAVAQLAAPIRGIADFGRLVSEDHRQYRRMIWTARAAVGALALLTVAAVWQWQTAVVQRDRAVLAEGAANKANARAQENAQEAKANADKAEANAETAQANLREAQIGQSRFLADQARATRTTDPGTAALLALAALPDRATGVDRPDVPEAELQLDGAWRELRERLDLVGHEDAVISAAFSPDGKRIVTASLDRTARVWDAATGQPIGEPLKGHTNWVISAAFSPDGSRIVTASEDKTARVWDATTDQPIGGPLKGHGEAVWGAAFSPDGKRIVTASDDNTARIWDTATSEPIGEPLYHDGRVLSAAFSSNGKRIVTASDDGIARVWDAASGKEIVELKGHKNVVSSAAFSADGERIVTASWDGTARIWNAASGKPVGKPLDGHERTVTSAAFSGDGRRVVTTSWDKTALIWDATSGELVGQLVGHNDTVNSAAFSPDGGSIVTASADGTAQIWNTPPDMQTLVSRATDFVSGSRRCLMPSQRKTFFLSGEPPAWCTQLLGKWDYETPARK